MPKPKRVLKRRTTKQQVNRRKNKRTTELLNELFDKDITNVPPHLLDKIPAGASLRPTAATLRQMTMQQLAPMYNPMPIFPQQQQAANLKNANDIREQTLNQSKQDFIIQNERKRDINRQESEFKIESKRQEHETAMEKDRLNQQAKMEETRKKLEREQQHLKIRQEELNKDNEINRLAMQVDDLTAINKQFEHNINTLKQQSQIEEKKRKYNQVLQRNQELNYEYNALIKTIKSFDGSPMKKRYKKLYEENAKLATEAEMLEKLKNTKQEAFMKNIENDALSNINLHAQFTPTRIKLQQSQVALAKQINRKEELERKLNRIKYLANKTEDIWQEQQDKELEAKRLEEQLKHSKTELPVADAIETVKKDIENKQKKDEIETKIKLQKLITDGKLLDAKKEFIGSQDYLSREELLAELDKAIQAAETKNKLAEDSIKLFIRAKQKQLDNEALNIANDAYISGRDPVSELMSMVNTGMDAMDRNAKFKIAGEEAEHMKQAMDIYRRKHEKVMGLYSANSPQGEAFRTYIEQNRINLSAMGPTELEHLAECVKTDIGINLF